MESGGSNPPKEYWDAFTRRREKGSKMDKTAKASAKELRTFVVNTKIRISVIYLACFWKVVPFTLNEKWLAHQILTSIDHHWGFFFPLTLLAWKSRDFTGGPVVKTSPSNARGVGLVPGWGAKIPHALQPKNQNIKQKQYCNKFNKDFKNGPHQ